MPFTLSHAFLAPPLAKLSGHRLPLGALAIGTMTPDLFRLFIQDEILINHQWQGIITPDLWVGLFFCLLWYALYRPLLFKFFNLKNPLNIDSFLTALQFLFWSSLAVIIGTSTHIIWDGLTHLDFRTFAFHDFLAQPVEIFKHEYPMHRVLQIGCSALALPFLAWMGIHYYLKYKVEAIHNIKFKTYSYLITLISFFCGCFYYVYKTKQESALIANADLYTYIGFFIKIFTQGSMISFTLGCVVLALLNHRKYFE